MSTFLGFESYLIPLGSTVDDVHTTIRAALTSKGWRITQDSLTCRIAQYLGNFNNATYPASLAFDNNSDTGSAAIPPTYPVWLGIRLNAPSEIRVFELAGSPATQSEAPKNFTIDYSDDGVSWTTALTVVNETGWNNRERRWFDVPASGNHLYWRINITANNGSGSWVTVSVANFYDSNMSLASTGNYFHAIPPVTEQIGDSKTRSLVRFEFSSSAITVRPVLQSMTPRTQQILSWQNVAGAVSYAITIDGVTVTQDPATVDAGNTSHLNQRYLYNAIRSSTDPIFLDYDWELLLPSNQNANDANTYIVGTCKTPNVRRSVVPNANVNARQNGSVAPSGAHLNPTVWSNGQSVTIDLINGFIYYLQVNSRGIGLATKTTAAFYGPVHACYANHSSALAAVPESIHASIIELVVGYDDPSTTDTDSWGRLTHFWGIPANSTHIFPPYSDSVHHPFGNNVLRYKVQDCVTSPTYAFGVLQFLGSNIWWDDSAVGNDFQVHRVSIPGIKTISNSDDRSSVLWTFFCPQIDVSDWYKFRGVATQESLILVADTQQFAQLSSQIVYNDSGLTQISVSNGLLYNQSGGFVSINDEVFQYTSVSGNTLLGVTRAKYSSIARSHFVGDAVYQALWFTVINGGALLCGYQKPS